MILSCIAAMSENRVIGADGKLPWRLPSDLAWFKRKTMGHPIVMGRRTWESIGCRPLPGRATIVLTTRPDYPVPEAVRVASSLEEALGLVAGEEEVFVVGGGIVYEQALPVSDRLYLTVVHANFAGDTCFPALDETAWSLVHQEARPADHRNAYAHTFRVYERGKRAS